MTGRMGTIRLRATVLAIAAIAVVVTGSALAASAASDPLSLVLQRSDMPTKAKYASGRLPAVEKALADAGITGTAAFHHSTQQLSSARNETVSGAVIVLKGAGDARKVYRLTKADLAPKRRQPRARDCLRRRAGRVVDPERRQGGDPRAQRLGCLAARGRPGGDQGTGAREAPDVRREADAADRERLMLALRRRGSFRAASFALFNPTLSC
jgi:hypothetical protein